MSDASAYEADINKLVATDYFGGDAYAVTNYTYSYADQDGTLHYTGTITGSSDFSNNRYYGFVAPVDAAHGVFSSMDYQGGYVTDFQILGASADGQYLVLGDVASPTVPAIVYTAKGISPTPEGSPLGTVNIGFDTSNVYIGPVCYCAGTMILTPTGERAIETLAAGDPVVTASGETRPVVWMGQQTIACARHPHPAEAHPILIARDAIGAGVPHRDLMVSPGHGIAITCLEPVFIEARALVNGATVRQVPADTVVYYHLELETHDVVVANGAAAESYLDVGNRHHLGGVATLRPSLDPAVDDLGSCHPRLADGPIVEAVRLQMAARAKALGWEVRPRTAALAITADDRALDITTVRSLLRCRIEPGARSIELRSDTFAAAQAGAPQDGRVLGVFVEELTVIGRDGSRTGLPLDHGCFANGFHAIEQGGIPYRWTDGDARIDLTAVGQGDIATLEITVGLQQQRCVRVAAPYRAAALAA